MVSSMTIWDGKMKACIALPSHDRRSALLDAIAPGTRLETRIQPAQDMCPHDLDATFAFVMDEVKGFDGTCHYDILRQCLVHPEGRSHVVAPDLLQAMEARGVLVKHETDFGDFEYRAIPEKCEFAMNIAVQNGVLAADMNYVSLDGPRIEVLRYPKLALMMKLDSLGWESTPLHALGSELELGSSKVFDRRWSRPKAYFGALLHSSKILESMPLGDGAWPSILHGGLEAYYRCVLQARTPKDFVAIQDVMNSGATADEQKARFILFTV